VDNVVHAHLLAWKALQQGKGGGQAYFITNDEPQELWTWIKGLLGELGLEAPRRRVPAGLAYGVGRLLELVYGWLGMKEEPIMTRFIARQLACHHTYNINKAKLDLGYWPLVSMAEATREIVEEARVMEGY
jgi:nucleoside-diphosphate-sugar epimerase